MDYALASKIMLMSQKVVSQVDGGNITILFMILSQFLRTTRLTWETLLSI